MGPESALYVCFQMQFIHHAIFTLYSSEPRWGEYLANACSRKFKGFRRTGSAFSWRKIPPSASFWGVHASQNNKRPYMPFICVESTKLSLSIRLLQKQGALRPLLLFAYWQLLELHFSPRSWVSVIRFDLFSQS